MIKNNAGFTLVELMVVISIIAILSVVGVVVYSNVQKSARDAQRRSELEAIAQAYEIKYPANIKYTALTGSDFAPGIMPKDPTATKGDYFNWLSSTGSGFKICASLESNPNPVCNTPAKDCVCKFSTQGSIPSSDTVNASGIQTNLGIGNATPIPICPDTLSDSTLIGHWKMDGDFSDSSGNNHGTAVNGASIVEGKIGKAGNFDGSNDYVNVPNYSAITGLTAITGSAWIRPFNTSPAGGEGRIMSRGSNGILFQMLGGGLLNVYINNAGNLRTGAILSPNTWQHIAFTWKAPSTVIIYFNGVVQDIVSGNLLQDSIGSNGLDLQLGSYAHPESDGTFPGQLDDVRIYSRALSGSEMQSLASGCIP